MKSLKITVTKGDAKTETNVKSECAMWNYLRKTRDAIQEAELTAGVRAVVVTEDGAPFKDITFRRNSKGKIEMPNAVKETNRIRVKPEKNTKKVVLKKNDKVDAQLEDVLAEAKEMATSAE